MPLTAIRSIAPIALNSSGDGPAGNGQLDGRHRPGSRATVVRRRWTVRRPAARGARPFVLRGTGGAGRGRWRRGRSGGRRPAGAGGREQGERRRAGGAGGGREAPGRGSLGREVCRRARLGPVAAARRWRGRLRAGAAAARGRTRRLAPWCGPAEWSRLVFVVFEGDRQPIAADAQFVAVAQAQPAMPELSGRPLCRIGPARADVLDPVGLLAVRKCGACTREIKRSGSGSVKVAFVRSADLPAAVVEASDQRVAQRFVVERKSSQYQSHV